MARKKPIVLVEVSDETRNDLRRSPRLRPNLKLPSFPRRSPRIGKLGKTSSVQDPRTPNLESVRPQSRRRSLVSPTSLCGGFTVNRGFVKVRQMEEVRKSRAFEKKLYAKANTAGEAENMVKERTGLRRSPRFSNQQKIYKDTDQKLDSALNEIFGTDGDAANSDQSVKRINIRRRSSSLVGSEEDLSQMGEEVSWKNEGKEDEGGKRKRKRGKEGSEVVRGWTKEQEMALERAYMAMKPTPRFWKKVSKMVGKSAQECFDRITFDQHTPDPPRIRSRIKKVTSPPVSGFSLSASKLLGSPEPTRKRKTRLGQKRVRQLLQKQCNIEKDYEGDLFSVLEGSMASPPLKVFRQTPAASTPPAMSLGNGSNSFSARKKAVSRLGKAVPLVSPSVLKQVKNKALHEKYIDQLHYREAKRKTELTRAKKTVFGKENISPNCNLKPNTVKAAKRALESDARDVILQFQQVQSKVLNNSPSVTEDDIRLSSEENEDELL